MTDGHLILLMWLAPILVPLIFVATYIALALAAVLIAIPALFLWQHKWWVAGPAAFYGGYFLYGAFADKINARFDVHSYGEALWLLTKTLSMAVLVLAGIALGLGLFVWFSYKLGSAALSLWDRLIAGLSVRRKNDDDDVEQPTPATAERSSGRVWPISIKAELTGSEVVFSIRQVGAVDRSVYAERIQLHYKKDAFSQGSVISSPSIVIPKATISLATFTFTFDWVEFYRVRRDSVPGAWVTAQIRLVDTDGKFVDSAECACSLPTTGANTRSSNETATRQTVATSPSTQMPDTQYEVTVSATGTRSAVFRCVRRGATLDRRAFVTVYLHFANGYKTEAGGKSFGELEYTVNEQIVYIWTTKTEPGVTHFSAEVRINHEVVWKQPLTLLPSAIIQATINTSPPTARESASADSNNVSGLDRQERHAASGRVPIPPTPRPSFSELARKLEMPVGKTTAEQRDWLQSEYEKWNRRVTHNDKAVRDQAAGRLKLIAEARALLMKADS